MGPHGGLSLRSGTGCPARIETMERRTFASLMVVTMLLRFSLTSKKTFPVIAFAAAFPFFSLIKL